MPLCDHVRPGSLHRVNRPTEVHAPILIKIIKSGVLEWLASADTSGVHEKVDSPAMTNSHRDHVPASGGSAKPGSAGGAMVMALNVADAMTERAPSSTIPAVRLGPGGRGCQ